MPAFGEVRGGAATILGGLLTTYEDLVMPAFTYRTMLIPEIGPENNGMVYGSGDESNEMAEMFHMICLWMKQWVRYPNCCEPIHTH